MEVCAGAGEPHPYEPSRKTRLHIGHIIDKNKGGNDDPSNLRAICSVCNEGAQNIMLVRPDFKYLIVQVRRARKEDQIEVMKWLTRKGPTGGLKTSCAIFRTEHQPPA